MILYGGSLKVCYFLPRLIPSAHFVLKHDARVSLRLVRALRGEGRCHLGREPLGGRRWGACPGARQHLWGKGRFQSWWGLPGPRGSVLAFAIFRGFSVSHFHLSAVCRDPRPQASAEQEAARSRSPGRC